MVATRFALVCLLFLTGCGYAITSTHSRLLEKEGVRRVYISPIRNETYKIGVENVVYNQLVKSLASFRGITLVQDPETADAIMTGIVTTADASITGTETAPQLNPGTIGAALPTILPAYANIYVANQYTANLTVSFALTRRNPGPGQKGSLWAGAMSRQEIYPASNQLGSLGTTSMLINQSEFDRAIQDVAHDMSSDVREAMLSGF